MQLKVFLAVSQQLGHGKDLKSQLEAVDHLLEHVPVVDHAVLDVRACLHPLLGKVESRRVDVVLLLGDVVSGNLGDVNLKCLLSFTDCLKHYIETLYFHT